MKARFNLVLIVMLALTTINIRAQEFTLTTTPANITSSRASIDMPGLTGNPWAIIVATPLGDAGTFNPNPLGVWYYANKWNIYNTNHAVMPPGLKYKIEFVLKPDQSHFVHVMTTQNIGSEGSYIDHPALNNNPNVRFKILQVHAPDVRPYNPNRFKAQASYSSAAGRWYIANVNGEPLGRDCAYNIVIGSAETVGTNPTPTQNPNPGTNPNPQASTPTTPAGNTGGNPSTSPVGGPQSPPANPNWTLREEPKPFIAPNSDILLFIHGMDSRAEEADDITKALFELMANRGNPPSGSSPTPDNAPTPPSPMAPALQQLLAKYKGCIRERYETQLDMVNRKLPADYSALATTYGLQDRDEIVCLAGNVCSLMSRIESLGVLQAQADRGDATNFEATLKKAVPKDCFECNKHQEMHTKHVHCTMEVGGNSGIEKGPFFEICKAGVDLKAVTDTFISAILSEIRKLVPPPTSTGGPTIGTNFETVRFDSCPNPLGGCPESCSNPDNFASGERAASISYETVDGRQVPLYFSPLIPLKMLDTAPPYNSQVNVPVGRNYGTNEGRLRAELRLAAAGAQPLTSLRLAAYEFAAGNIEMGKAYADLSVTGHRAFDEFKKAPPNESFCQSLRGSRPAQNENELLEGCRKALDRAYAVANYLRTGQRGDTPAEKTRKTRERLELGWIAVSGEDDSPHRPVNAPSSDFPQFNIDVDAEAPLVSGAKTVKVRTRYVIAQSPTSGTGGSAKNLVVISLDLPSSGYTENLDYEDVSPLSEIGAPKALIDFQATGKTPLLDFIETFIVRFSEKLRQEVPISNNFKAVMGGSLGGNMTFRLGRRSDVPWLPKFIVWSPASIWQSLGEGSDILKHQGPRGAWEGANAARNSPSVNDRAKFFGSWDQPIFKFIIPMAQSDTWTSDYYPCKKSAVAAARLDRHETYDARFLAWHWRLGGEQLLYSHQTKDPVTNRPRFMANQKPMLLACGKEDRVPFNDICPATESTAPFMTGTPGKALFLDKTGHSLDNERRTYFARQIVEFLGL
jgi:pimeloyl-ACP methyl ester carboxylesterase